MSNFVNARQPKYRPFLRGCRTFALVFAIGVLPSTYGQGNEHVRWTAMSHTAYAITGEIESTPKGFKIAGNDLPLQLIRKFGPEEIENAAKMFDLQNGANLSGGLYRTRLSSSARLVNGNTFCGKDDTKWIVVLISDKRQDLHMANFSGDSEPDLHPSIIGKSTNFCGTYWYQKASAGTNN